MQMKSDRDKNKKAPRLLLPWENMKEAIRKNVGGPHGKKWKK